MILTKTQVNNITRNIILDYIRCKKIINTSNLDIVKRIPKEYLKDPTIVKELNTDLEDLEDGNLTDSAMIKVCREFIKDVEGRNSIEEDIVIDFRRKVEVCLIEAGNIIIDNDTNIKL